MPGAIAELGLKAVIFDLDGVLIDSMPFHYAAYHEVLAAEGLPVTEDDIYLREGLGTPDVLRALSKANGWGLTEDRVGELADRRREIFYRIYQHRVYPGVVDLLTGIERAGLPRGVVSGATGQSLQMCLHQQRVNGTNVTLGRWFSVVVSGTQVARGKPHPDPYLRALEQMSQDAADTLVIENAPMGIQAARAAGCPCVALQTTLRHEHLTQANWVLEDHAQLFRWFGFS